MYQVFAVRDGTHENCGGALAAARYDYAYVNAFNFEVWYPLVAPLRVAFPAVNAGGQSEPKSICSQLVRTVPLMVEEAKCLCELAQKGANEQDCLCIPTLAALGARIAQTIGKSEEWFVKLSTRSMKDTAGGATTPVSQPSEVLHLLVTSMRAYNDLKQFVEEREGGRDSAAMALHFQVWRTVSHAREVRCFVKGGQLRAVSQYDLGRPFVFADCGEAGIRDCVAALRALIAAVHAHLPWLDYVLDAEVLATGAALVVEFNPYGRDGTTSAILFDWTRDESLLCGAAAAGTTVRYRTTWCGGAKRDVVIP
eukprot:TRINITY_DN1012_c0_g1_i1.p1 TRINITY_DN1012_c0_g1~~TRINITY_DN1012_c0_g1_i1.p1  ORF type:complete len:310 (+),score=86.62 TRINITY_DN1012_c0_g1_i1:55-984(+)